MISETVAVDDYDFSDNEDLTSSCLDNSQPSLWGKLIPLNPHLPSLELQSSTESYSFGKEDCLTIFSADQFSRTHFGFISKRHFIIKKQSSGSGDNDYDVVLQDISSNGTLVNGKKIGKNKFHVLQTNDEISLAISAIKVFMFINPNGSTNNFHCEVTDKYLVGKMLGKGACGEVFLVFLEGNFAEQFAMKVVDKKSFSVVPSVPSTAINGGLTRSQASEVMSEVNILKKLSHPCIINVEDIMDFPDRLYLVLERAMGGELFDRVVKHDGLSESTAKLFFYQMCQAVNYLHRQNITHRDLKPENILLATEDEITLIKVTDFGLSKLVGEQSLMKTLCGTPNYLAPEIVKTSGMGHYSSKIDCWSLGVILFIMLGAYPPFSDDYEDLPLVDQIKKARFSFPADTWSEISKQAKQLISKLLVVTASKRLSCEQALKHDWLQDDEMWKTAENLMNKKEVAPLAEPETETGQKYSFEEDGKSAEVSEVVRSLKRASDDADLLNSTSNSSDLCEQAPSEPDTDVKKLKTSGETETEAS